VLIGGGWQGIGAPPGADRIAVRRENRHDQPSPAGRHPHRPQHQHPTAGPWHASGVHGDGGGRIPSRRCVR
jgi:hypothetical protein